MQFNANPPTVDLWSNRLGVRSSVVTELRAVSQGFRLWAWGDTFFAPSYGDTPVNASIHVQAPTYVTLDMIQCSHPGCVVTYVSNATDMGPMGQQPLQFITYSCPMKPSESPMAVTFWASYNGESLHHCSELSPNGMQR